MKKPKKKTLRAKADKIFSQYWREKIGKCENCRKSNGVQLQLAHITTRGCIKLRYQRKNTFVLCAGCHRFFHNQPLVFSIFVGRMKGSNIVDELIRESNQLEPITIKFYEDIIKKYSRVS